MAITRSSSTVLNAVPTTQASASQDVSPSYAAEWYVSIAVAGTASTAAGFQILSEPDGATDYNSPAYQAGTAAGTYYWVIPVPVAAKATKILFTQQVGGTSSTCTAQLGQITAV